jgi:hypothetical protein
MTGGYMDRKRKKLFLISFEKENCGNEKASERKS